MRLDSLYQTASCHEFINSVRNYVYRTGRSGGPNIAKIYPNYTDLPWDSIHRLNERDKIGMMCGGFSWFFSKVLANYNIQSVPISYGYKNSENKQGHIQTIVELSEKDDTHYYVHDATYDFVLVDSSGEWVDVRKWARIAAANNRIKKNLFISMGSDLKIYLNTLECYSKKDTNYVRYSHNQDYPYRIYYKTNSKGYNSLFEDIIKSHGFEVHLQKEQDWMIYAILAFRYVGDEPFNTMEFTTKNQKMIANALNQFVSNENEKY